MSALSPADRAAVVYVGGLIRAAVLRKAAREADLVADAVVTKLGKVDNKGLNESVPLSDRVLWTYEEAASYLGISVVAFRKRLQRRRIKGVVDAGGGRQIHRETFLASLQKRAVR